MQLVVMLLEDQVDALSLRTTSLELVVREAREAILMANEVAPPTEIDLTEARLSASSLLAV